MVDVAYHSFGRKSRMIKMFYLCYLVNQQTKIIHGHLFTDCFEWNKIGSGCIPSGWPTECGPCLFIQLFPELYALIFPIVILLWDLWRWISRELKRGRSNRKFALEKIILLGVWHDPRRWIKMTRNKLSYQLILPCRSDLMSPISIWSFMASVNLRYCKWWPSRKPLNGRQCIDISPDRLMLDIGK